MMALNLQNLRKHPNFTSEDARAMQKRSAAARKRNREAREALEAAGISVLMSKMKLPPKMRAAFGDFGMKVPENGRVPTIKAYFMRMVMVGLKNGDARIIETLTSLSGLGRDTAPDSLGGMENPLNVANIEVSAAAIETEAVKMGIYENGEADVPGDC